jgi:hypothetical protein
MVVDNLKLKTMLPFLQANIDREARVMTDDAGQYLPLHKHFPAHGVVNHSAGEYVSRIDGSICQRRLKSDPLCRLIAEVNLTHPGTFDRAARARRA